MFETKSEVLNDSGQAMQALWHRAYPDVLPELGINALETVLEAFQGSHPDYEAIDAPYHDLEHTLRAGLCFMQLVEKNQCIRDFPSLTPELAQLGWVATLFHDTGYLKHRGDVVGSGAKHSFVHVARSQRFAADWMVQSGMNDVSIRKVHSMIQCTEFNDQPLNISFESKEHRMGGCLVGTADWLGQMGAPDYLQKLPLLHQEMLEAQQCSPGTSPPISIPETAEDLLHSTPPFFERWVKPKLEKEFDGVFRLLNSPYPDGANPYLEQIRMHLETIEQNRGPTPHRSR